MLNTLLGWIKGRPAPAAPVADPDALRHTPLGPVIGFADRHDTHAWLGIPYAQPPVGALRWKNSPAKRSARHPANGDAWLVPRTA
jgi:hypothetical protein